MAEFGINATNLSAPQGAGASPVQGVGTPASNALAYSIPAGLTQVLGAGIKTLFEKEDPSAAVLAKFTRETNALADAYKQGAMNPTEVADRKQALFREFSSSNPELIKQLQEIGGWTAKYSGFEEAEAEMKLAQEREADFRKRALDVGFRIDDNTSPEMRLSVEGFIQELNYSNATLSSLQQKQSLVSSQDEYTQRVTKRTQEEEIRQTSLRLASGMFDAFNSSITDLQKRMDAGDPELNPETALQQVRAQAALYQSELTKLEIVDPERATAIRRTLELQVENAQKLFDPNVSADIKSGLIKDNINSVQIALLSDTHLLSSAALQEMFRYTDMLQIRDAGAMLNGLTDIMSTYDNPFAKVNPVVGMGEKGKEKEVYQGFRESINAWQKLQGSANSKDMEGYLKEGANNILEQFGDLVESRKATPNDYVAALDLMQSPEFRTLAKNGGLDPDSISSAETALVYGFRESQAVRGQFNKNLMKTYEPPKVGSRLVQGMLPTEGFQYIDVITPQFDKASGTLSFGVEPEFRGSLLSRNSVKGIIEEFDNTKKSLNLSIRAHANLLNMDVGSYWEAYKHEILPEYFGKVEIGHEVNGSRYIGGPPNRKSSWEPIGGGKDGN